MSGGSFDYLCYNPNKILCNPNTLDEMICYCANRKINPGIIRQLKRLKRKAVEANKLFVDMFEIHENLLQAIEWEASGDWSVEAIEDRYRIIKETNAIKTL